MYHEKQRLQCCAVHALNNLLGGPVVSKSILDEIATELAPDAWLNPHRSIFGLGNYDVNVLLIALERQGYKASYFDTRKAIQELRVSDPQVIGLICNVAGIFTRHWLAIRRQDAIFYNLDSKRASPLVRIGVRL